VTIGEDFESQVGDGKIRTTFYKVRWEGYDKKQGNPSHIYRDIIYRDMIPWYIVQGIT